MFKKVAMLLVSVLVLPTFWCDAPAAGFRGTGEPVPFRETITFTGKITDTDQLSVTLPAYLGIGTDVRVPVAGTVLLGYYDIWKPNLIPDFTSAYSYNGTYYYAAQNDKVNAAMSSLAELMGTNVSQAGTTVSQFKKGFSAYVSGKGYTASYASVMGGGFSLATYKNKIAADIPLIVFVDGYRYSTLAGYTSGETSDTFVGNTSVKPHACVGYGYKTIKYYNNGTNFRTDTYLLVSFGDNTKGYLLLETAKVVDAYAVTI